MRTVDGHIQINRPPSSFVEMTSTGIQSPQLRPAFSVKGQ